MNKYTHSVLILLLWINIAHRAYSSHPHSLTAFAQQAITHRIVLYNEQYRNKVLTFSSQTIPNTQQTYQDATHDWRTWNNILSTPSPKTLVLDENDTIKGIVTIECDSNKIEINSFATHPQQRIGSTLLFNLANEYDNNINTWRVLVYKSNHPAQKIYEHWGFTKNLNYSSEKCLEYTYNMTVDPHHFRLPKTFNTILTNEWNNLLILPQKNTDLCIILPFRSSSYSTFCSRHWYATLFTMGITATIGAYYVYNRTPKALVGTILLPMIHYGIYQHGQRQNEHLLQKTYGGNFPLLDDVANTIHGPAHVIATVPKVFFQNYLHKNYQHKTFPNTVSV